MHYFITSQTMQLSLHTSGVCLKLSFQFSSADSAWLSYYKCVPNVYLKHNFVLSFQPNSVPDALASLPNLFTSPFGSVCAWTTGQKFNVDVCALLLPTQFTTNSDTACGFSMFSNHEFPTHVARAKALRQLSNSNIFLTVTFKINF